MVLMNYEDLLNTDSLDVCFEHFHGELPFDHCIIDNFIVEPVISDLELEFLSYESDRWFRYENVLENKKALNDWNVFPSLTYRTLSTLCSTAFVTKLSTLCGVPLIADNGLHGGGWHVHGPNGNLNPHLDYSIHPKLGLLRKLNLIIYVSRHLKEEHGGHLGLWEHDQDNNCPGKLVKEIAPLYNRAVLFDTTQNSWHGMSRPLTPPPGVLRKSLALYFLCKPPTGAECRGRALFAARYEQRGDKSVADLIKQRSDVNGSLTCYRIP